MPAGVAPAHEQRRGHHALGRVAGLFVHFRKRSEQTSRRPGLQREMHAWHRRARRRHPDRRVPGRPHRDGAVIDGGGLRRRADQSNHGHRFWSRVERALLGFRRVRLQRDWAMPRAAPAKGRGRCRRTRRRADGSASRSSSTTSVLGAPLTTAASIRAAGRASASQRAIELRLRRTRSASRPSPGAGGRIRLGTGRPHARTLRASTHCDH